jgi:acyl-CoA synthetase (AMP-forming)/AMP-acid ligase II
MGDLYVIGRIKDMIISAGGVFSEISKRSCTREHHPGRVVAFGVDDQAQGTESLAVVAEMRGEFDVVGSCAGTSDSAANRLGSRISVRYVRVTPGRWIVKSTAGKISRRETRLRFLEESSSSGVPNRA